MNIKQEFEPYCEGCPFLIIKSEKILAVPEDKHIISCAHRDICGHLWERFNDLSKQAG